MDKIQELFQALEFQDLVSDTSAIEPEDHAPSSDKSTEVLILYVCYFTGANMPPISFPTHPPRQQCQDAVDTLAPLVMLIYLFSFCCTLHCISCIICNIYCVSGVFYVKRASQMQCWVYTCTA